MLVCRLSRGFQLPLWDQPSCPSDERGRPGRPLIYFYARATCFLGTKTRFFEIFLGLRVTLVGRAQPIFRNRQSRRDDIFPAHGVSRWVPGRLAQASPARGDTGLALTSRRHGASVALPRLCKAVLLRVFAQAPQSEPRASQAVGIPPWRLHERHFSAPETGVRRPKVPSECLSEYSNEGIPTAWVGSGRADAGVSPSCSSLSVTATRPASSPDSLFGEREAGDKVPSPHFSGATMPSFSTRRISVSSHSLAVEGDPTDAPGTRSDRERQTSTGDRTIRCRIDGGSSSSLA